MTTRNSLASDSPVDTAEALERLKARIERIARDVETDHRTGKLKTKLSNGVDIARRLREACDEL